MGEYQVGFDLHIINSSLTESYEGKLIEIN